MKKTNYLQLTIIIIGILAVTRISTAQDIRFEVSLPGIHIVAGEPYPVFIPQPRIIYYEPLPEGYYYYDERDDCYYNDYGDVYYYPSNVYRYRHDNGKHKGWYKKRHRQDREDYDHDGRYERDDD